MPIASNQTLLLLIIQNYAYFLNYPNISMLKLPPPRLFRPNLFHFDQYLKITSARHSIFRVFHNTKLTTPISHNFFGGDMQKTSVFVDYRLIIDNTNFIKIYRFFTIILLTL